MEAPGSGSPPTAKLRRLCTKSNNPSAKCYPDTNPLERITCKFENLREVILTTNFDSHSSVLSIVSLLRFAPHIEDLDIIAYTTNEEEEDEVDEDFLNSERSDNLFSSLKYVSLGGVRYLPNQMRFMKFICRCRWIVGKGT